MILNISVKLFTVKSKESKVSFVTNAIDDVFGISTSIDPSIAEAQKEEEEEEEKEEEKEQSEYDEQRRINSGASSSSSTLFSGYGSSNTLGG